MEQTTGKYQKSANSWLVHILFLLYKKTNGKAQKQLHSSPL